MEVGSSMYEELWRACAGPLVHLPQTGERVYYFPQGHLEQVLELRNENSKQMMSLFSLPSKILCRVVNIYLQADEKTDEVYAQITLFPELSQVDVDELDPLLHEPLRPVVKTFYKKLTATDLSSKLHVRQHDANNCFPPLDMTREKPSQELVAEDLHGFSWYFKHILTGNPKRHVLTTGWKHFAKSKELVAGDSIIFIRGENGKLRVGVRHTSNLRKTTPYGYLDSGDHKNLTIDILATVSHAVNTNAHFTVYYRPSCGISQFIVGRNKYIESDKKVCSIGMRFSMRFEEEGHKQTRCNGSIVEVGGDNTHRASSMWRCLKVQWDEVGATMRPIRISPWEIDPPELINIEQTPYQRRNGAKKERLQPSQMAIDPLMSSQQCWIQDEGLPNWTSLYQICQQQWAPNAELQQTDVISTGPLLSNEDNWLQEMINNMELPDRCNIQIPGHDEVVQYEELGQIFGSAENGGINMIECNQFPKVSPTIHFSEINGERVSYEESIQGVDTRKRKLTSVGDDRQVKSRVEASEFPGVDSNSDQTHYFSASEGECSQDLTPTQVPGNGNDRGLISRVWDRVFGPLLHQLKNYVAK